MAKYYEMTLVDRQRIARDTMAFWRSKQMVPASNSELGSMPTLSSRARAWSVKATIPGHSLSQAFLVTKSQS